MSSSCRLWNQRHHCANLVNLVNKVRSQCRQHRQWGQYRPSPTRPPSADVALSALQRRLAAAGFLTALTVLTRLTVLTADRIGVVANVDDFSEIIYERQSDGNSVSGFCVAALRRWEVLRSDKKMLFNRTERQCNPFSMCISKLNTRFN